MNKSECELGICIWVWDGMGDLHCSDLMKWDEKEHCGLVLFHLHVHVFLFKPNTYLDCSFLFVVFITKFFGYNFDYKSL